MENKYFPNSLMVAVRYFSDPDSCVSFVAGMRWPSGVTCPHCEGVKVSFLKSRRIWKCMAKQCHKQFSAKTGTVFEDSPIPLDKWMTAVWLVVNCKHGISSYELARDLKVTQKSAWFMLHRIRIALRNETIENLGGDDGGPAGETFIGGMVKNMYQTGEDAEVGPSKGKRDCSGDAGAPNPSSPGKWEKGRQNRGKLGVWTRAFQLRDGDLVPSSTPSKSLASHQ